MSSLLTHFKVELGSTVSEQTHGNAFASIAVPCAQTEFAKELELIAFSESKHLALSVGRETIV